MPEQPDNKAFSLEQWIIESRNGDEDALNHLAGYLLPKALGFANQKMRNVSPVDDYEDVAVSAVRSICLRFRDGHQDFLGEKELVSLIRKFVIGKIRTRQKYHFAEKRDVQRNSKEGNSGENSSSPDQAVDAEKSIWLDEHSLNLPVLEQAYLAEMLNSLGGDVRGLFSELVKRLDEKPRKVLMLITTGDPSNMELAEALDCAPASIERYRNAIRRKLEEIVNE